MPTLPVSRTISICRDVHVGQQAKSSGGKGGLNKAAIECGRGALKGEGGREASNRYTFEHLFLITPFVLDITNGLQTGHTCGHTERRLR